MEGWAYNKEKSYQSKIKTPHGKHQTLALCPTSGSDEGLICVPKGLLYSQPALLPVAT